VCRGRDGDGDGDGPRHNVLLGRRSRGWEWEDDPTDASATQLPPRLAGASRSRTKRVYVCVAGGGRVAVCRARAWAVRIYGAR
jgi:hypothetical protein